MRLSMYKVESRRARAARGCIYKRVRKREKGGRCRARRESRSPMVDALDGRATTWRGFLLATSDKRARGAQELLFDPWRHARWRRTLLQLEVGLDAVVVRVGVHIEVACSIKRPSADLALGRTGELFSGINQREEATRTHGGRQSKGRPRYPRSEAQSHSGRSPRARGCCPRSRRRAVRRCH